MHISTISAMSSDQWPAFCRMVLECDGMVNLYEDHLGEYTVALCKQYDEWLWK